MTTNITRKRTDMDGIKILIGSASLAATLGLWSLFANLDEAAAAPVSVNAEGQNASSGQTLGDLRYVGQPSQNSTGASSSAPTIVFSRRTSSAFTSTRSS